MKARLYLDSRVCPKFSSQGLLALDSTQHHYLCTVLRLKNDSVIHIFNEAEGEWEASLITTEKKSQARLIRRRRQATVTPPLHLIFAPLKHDAMEFLLEKATELGVSDLWPVLTERTVNRFFSERMAKHTLKAAQQSGRLALPRIHPPQNLKALLDTWPASQPLIVAQEPSHPQQAQRLTEVLAAIKPRAFLIGPEGGISNTELIWLSHYPFIRLITLGSNTLRAETAALACLAVWQAFQFD